MEDKPAYTDGIFPVLRTYTAARIGLGRTGTSTPLRETLRFRLAHAHARDAVFSEADIEKLRVKTAAADMPVAVVHSRAENREMYLQNPDAGRRLSASSAAELQKYSCSGQTLVVVADGLSALAVDSHAANLLDELLPALAQRQIPAGLIVLAQQSRVALADEIGGITGAKLSIILIGERPGLSSADSLGAYLTLNPRQGLTDESRNCVSNIRPEGFPLKAAAQKIAWLASEAVRRGVSGISLKDQHEDERLE
ncbi:MAG: ethanolamine ammonia-lyase subunit EutC [Mucilaginibacter polytrichastri]|nr:ethanolamine ammonia-lyase subunit EutC [Mucilaginibacter polytrichastri]